MSSEDQTRVWDLMNDLDYCMLVTQTTNGLRSRPMSSIVKHDEGKIYFLSDTNGAKDDEIAQNPQILLAYANGSNKFVSTTATATISSDRELIKRLWNPGAQAFWPEGPDASNIVVIVAQPTGAEYWDGSNALVSTVKFAMAIVTGTKPAMGDSEKVIL
jgi:general stress protein 26